MRTYLQRKKRRKRRTLPEEEPCEEPQPEEEVPETDEHMISENAEQIEAAAEFSAEEPMEETAEEAEAGWSVESAVIADVGDGAERTEAEKTVESEEISLFDQPYMFTAETAEAAAALDRLVSESLELTEQTTEENVELPTLREVLEEFSDYGQL